MKYFDQLHARIVKNAKIYIIPTKQGFLYVSINFTLFLIGLTYANNFTLLISFILFIFLLMSMFHTHQIMEQFSNPQILYRKGDAKQFRLNINNLNPLINVKYYFNRKKTIQFERAHDSNYFRPLRIKRGQYSGQNFQFFTTGVYNLFYVWTYRAQKQDFFIYPTPIKTDPPNSAMEQKFIPTGHDEFSHHNPYKTGENSKRIDWKVYARTQNLYSKKFTNENPIGLKLDYHQFSDDHETRLSKMAYLIEKTKTENNKFECKLPHYVLPLDKGEAHRQKGLELLSKS